MGYPEIFHGFSHIFPMFHGFVDPHYPHSERPQALVLRSPCIPFAATSMGGGGEPRAVPWLMDDITTLWL